MRSPWPRGRAHVAEAEREEVDALAEIHELAFARPWSAEELAALLDGAGVLCLVAHRTGLLGGRRAVGFALIRRAADEAEVLTIAVLPDWRGQGFGRLLMEAGLRRLYEERTRALFLEVSEANAAALALYRRLGFEQVGERRGYYSEPGGPRTTALVMRLQLR